MVAQVLLVHAVGYGVQNVESYEAESWIERWQGPRLMLLDNLAAELVQTHVVHGKVEVLLGRADRGQNTLENSERYK